MKSITNIIKDDSEININRNLNLIKPLLDKYKTQICILSNKTRSLNMKGDFSILEYDEKAKSLSDFYKSLSIYDNMLIMENGNKYNEKLVSYIAEILEREDSITFWMKTNNYITDDDYYIDKTIILLNKEAKSEEQIDILIDNTKFIDAAENELYILINELLAKRYYEEFIKWYKYVLDEKNASFISLFYSMTEEIKLTLGTEENYVIEQYFVKYNYDHKYTDFLYLKSMILQRAGVNQLLELCSAERMENIKNISMTRYLTYYAASANYNIDLLVRFENLNSLGNSVQRLLEIDKQFYIKLYNYIVAIDAEKEISIPGNQNILYYLKLTKEYLKGMNDKSYIKEKKEKLIQIFIEYTNYLFYVIDTANGIDRSCISIDEINLISKVGLAIREINLNNIGNAIGYLEEASFIIEYACIPIRFYIQSLIHDNHLYSNKISVCMIAKNEEKHIGRCLNAFKPLIDCGLAEVIVVDTGSEDRTVEIARQYTSRVYYHEWNNDFAEARNYSIAMAKGEYLFIVDADEELDSKAQDKLKEIFEKEENKLYSTFSFKEKNYIDEEYKQYSMFTRFFMFKHDEDFCYLGSVHEQPNFKENVKNLDEIILHYGYIMDDAIRERKFLRNLTMLRKELVSNQDNLYYRYQIITTYLMHDDKKEALMHAEILLNKISQLSYSRHFLSYYSSIVMTYNVSGMHEEAIRICDLALRKQEDFIDLIYYKAEAFFIMEKYVEALKSVKEYLMLLDEFHRHEIYNNVEFLFCTLGLKEKAINIAMVCCFENKSLDEFIKYAEAIEDESVLKNSLRLIIEGYFSIDNISGLFSFYENKIITAKDKILNKIFVYFILNKAMDSSSKNKEIVLQKFNQYKDLYTELDIEKIFEEHNSTDKFSLLLNFLEYYNINDSDILTARLFIYDILDLVDRYKIDETMPKSHIKNYRNCIKFVLRRTLIAKQFKGLSKDKLLDLTNKYINISLFLLSTDKNLMAENEVVFIQCFKNAFSHLENGDLINAIRSLKEGVEADNDMARPMELFFETILPGYELNI